MLPLFLANCDKLVYHDHSEYGRRGWTMLERTVFAAFNKPVIAVLQPRLGTLESGRPILPAAASSPAPFSGRSLRTAATRTLHVLDDPAEGLLTDPDTDRPLLSRLLELTQQRWGLCWRGTSTQRSLEGMQGLDSLVFGKTEVVVETAEMLDVVGGGSTVMFIAGGGGGSLKSKSPMGPGSGSSSVRPMDAMGSLRAGANDEGKATIDGIAMGDVEMKMCISYRYYVVLAAAHNVKCLNNVFVQRADIFRPLSLPSATHICCTNYGFDQSTALHLICFMYSSRSRRPSMSQSWP
jgi:hypothetical protein